MLNSDRKFGVEIEFIAPNARSFRTISNQINVVHDGSLRPHRNAGEYVSSVLQGASGESMIRNACGVLKYGGVDIENPATSMHIHLDGKKNNGDVVMSNKRIEGTTFQIGVSNRVLGKTKVEDIKRIVSQRNVYFFPSSQTKQIDDVFYISRGDITRHPRMNYKYFGLIGNDRSKWLRNVFYFYTQYCDVMELIVSKSRRCGNMYCIPLNSSFELEDIEKCKTLGDVANVWYKGNGSSGHYDDSRYHNVNLHSYFDRHGTVEIRSHGGTIDPNKVLLWVRLHQYIVDKMEDMELSDIKVDTSNKDAVILSFINFLQDDEVLVEYVKRMLGYFSRITIKGNEVIRK